jgi:predicted nucleotidyltransferase
MTKNGVELPTAAIEAFCRKWLIAEFALFGSVLRPDFRPESDIDVLVTFASDAKWDLWDFVAIKDELEALLGRSVDLVEKRAVRNPLLRREILSNNEVIYAA